jgi:hypothetical protein
MILDVTCSRLRRWPVFADVRTNAKRGAVAHPIHYATLRNLKANQPTARDESISLAGDYVL